MGKQSVNLLIGKGVQIDTPTAVHVDDDISVDRISCNRVTIHAGCKLFGHRTLICDGVELGYEGPVTLKNCYVGPYVKLKGGYFEGAVFLEGAEVGSGAHVRGGTILEEQASIAHTVGLKQTILFPYVTLGSLINFCDCLMAGGTSRKNHSEVGSSYVHFNYTPNQDKATPSLIGDVANGVMLNQSPIFLGGQGGMVGPCRIAYGTTVAAGSICRKDQKEENHLVVDSGPRSARMPFKAGRYHNINRILSHNFNYIGNLFALKQWYEIIRALFTGPGFPEPLLQGLNETLKFGIDERVKQLGRLMEKVQASLTADDHGTISQAFCLHWENIQSVLTELSADLGAEKEKDKFADIIQGQIKQTGKNYMACIKSLAPDQAQVGSNWLQSIVDHSTEKLLAQLQQTRG